MSVAGDEYGKGHSGHPRSTTLEYDSDVMFVRPSQMEESEPVRRDRSDDTFVA
jgi:hypothetical protein